MQNRTANDESGTGTHGEQVASSARHAIMPKLHRLEVARRPGKFISERGEDPMDNQAFFQLTDDLAVSFYLQNPDGRLDMSWRALQESGIDEEERFSVAVSNLHKAIYPVFKVKQLGLQAPPGSPDNAEPGAKFFHFIETGGEMEAACLLIGSIWEVLRPLASGDLRIVVPNRSSCLFCGADNTFVLAMMRDIGRSTMNDSGADGLSDRIYTINTNGQLREVNGS